MAKKKSDPAPETPATPVTPPVEVVNTEGKALATVSNDTAQRALDRLRPTRDGTRISLPRIVLLQSTSGESTRVEDRIAPGQFFHRTTKEVLGKDVYFIVLMNFTQRMRLKLNEGLKCRSVDTFVAQMLGGMTYDGQPTDQCSACKFKDWPRDRKLKGDKSLSEEQEKRGPECNLVESFPCLIIPNSGFKSTGTREELTAQFEGVNPEDLELGIFSMSKSSSKAAQDLLGNQMISKKAWPSFIYRNVSQSKPGPGNNTFYVQDVSRVVRTPDSLLKATEEWIQFLGNPENIEVDVTPEEVDPSVGGAPAAPSKPEGRF